MKSRFVLSTVVFALFMAGCQSPVANMEMENLTQYVDPHIGTGGHGHVFMGANVPFGFVQLGPTQHTEGWDWCSGYHYSDSTIIGFGHLHLSGTGIGDLGDVAFMPIMGDVATTRGVLPDEDSGIYSYFDRATEVAKAGYYSVVLERFGIQAELTATPRAGFHKYTFPEGEQPGILIDLEHGIGWDRPTDAHIVLENDTVVSGYRRSSGWAKDQVVYFTAIFSKPVKTFKVFDGLEPKEGQSLNGRKLYGQAVFEDNLQEPVLVKAGFSAVSSANALENLLTELPGWDFEGTAIAADQAWNEQLNKIVIQTKDVAAKRTFYTSLYHTMIAPSLFQDVNGDYRGADFQVHNDTSYTNYTTFSLWDTYRAAQPLMTLIHPEMVPDVAQTMINIYQQQGKLPVWHLMGNETDCMVGNPAIPVLADIILKGYKVDEQAAYEAMKQSAMLDERGLDLYKEHGYIPFDKHVERESVAIGLEYALADWSLAQVAKKLGFEEDCSYFQERSNAYRHYFDSSSGFIRGRSSEGAFRDDFNPFKSVHMGDDFCEGNAWQYLWLVPQDVNGLVNLLDGKEAFVAKLDSLFVAEGDMGEQASSDITGLIGQYAHGNEPGHHIPYLYAMVGEPWKTADVVHEILTTMYDDTPEGLSGNEDVGQMSAWYILSSMGFYPVEPAGGQYIFGRPFFDEVSIRVKGNNVFHVIAHNNSPENKYIQRILLNGVDYKSTSLSHQLIERGGHLEFFMGDAPTMYFE
jgi:predicted alpha-1,2-mannosidase